MGKTLRPYQTSAKRAFFGAVAVGSTRALIVMATGLGKTFTAAEIYDDWRKRFGGRTIFIVHQAGIAEQAMDEFRAHLPKTVMCGILTGDRAENVADCDILFTTFQSMHAKARRVFGRKAFNFIIVDEAHHGEADTFKPAIKYFKTKMTLGLTATPNRGDGKNIREIFGEEIFSYHLAQGIADGWLAELDYRVESDNIDRARLQELVDRVTGGDRTVAKSDLDSTIFLHERIEAIERRVRKVEDEKFGRIAKKIIFCRNLTHVRAVMKVFPDAVPYHSLLSSDTQRQILADFKAGIVREVLVRDMFNEGIDVPDAEMLVFLRGTKSETIWLQQLGRGIRKANGKTHVTVLDFVANCDRIRAVDELAWNIICHLDDEDKDERERRSRLHIEGTGWSFNFAEETRDIIGLLSRMNTPFYSTYAEASAAARALGVTSEAEYEEGYRFDLRLPSNPAAYYDGQWTDWYNFLGKERKSFYDTMEEAGRAAITLGIGTPAQYKMQHKKDPRLPSNPNLAYKATWMGWPQFFGRGRSKPYTTVKDASAATRRLGIASQSQYRTRYKEDPRLPSYSHLIKMKGWVGAGPFFGNT